MIARVWLGALAGLCLIKSPLWGAVETSATLPTSLYEEWRRSPAPANGAIATSNPPSLLWASVKHWEGRKVKYVVSISTDAAFPPERTRRFPAQQACFLNLHAKLEPGVWYWRHEIEDGTSTLTQGPYSFTIKADTPVFTSPTFEEFLKRIPEKHPQVITHGRDLAEIRRNAQTHPLAGDVIRRGTTAAKAAIYSGPVEDRQDAARGRSLARRAGQEIKLLHALIDAHVLAPSSDLLEAAIKRIEVLLGWPTDDLLGSQVLTALAKAFDALHAELPPALRERMLAVIARQIEHDLAAWPGLIEGRQVENHFWQMELAGNFTAALATVHELKASREMLGYTYELFLARFPNLATRAGGWSEGFSYFGVNESAIVDMALLMKRVGGFDVFKLEWYRSLADYFLYFAPLGGRIDGFGDSHDRVGDGDIGHGMMLVIGQENQDERALYRAARLEEKFGPDAESWYRIVENLRFDPAKVGPPTGLPQARMFPGVGLAAFHTDVLESARDTAVYFRSSPFGAKGHMHANQNAFNLSRRGEPIFYSSGYYTTFADAHSLSSYRHTRAHNTVLVNGCGQAFGHEGYGWIKRYADGRDISYVCGDATKAYQMPVDKQFLQLLADAGIAATRENGFGDGRLRLFERHLLLVRPDTVVIYDVLESEDDSEWALLLHAMREPRLAPDGQLELETGKNRARVRVIGSEPLVARLSDEFHVAPVDTLKKYRELPNQYHVRYTSAGKSRGMRFLSVMQLSDSGRELAQLPAAENGAVVVNGVRIFAEFNVARPAALRVEADSAALFVNAWPAQFRGNAMPKPDHRATLLLQTNGGVTRSTVVPDTSPAL